MNVDGHEDEHFPPLDRLSIFDVLENLALRQRLESLQDALARQTENLRQSQQKLALRVDSSGREVVQQLKRVPQTSEEQFLKYRNRIGKTLEQFSQRWNSQKNVTLQEKISFVTAVLNLFVSGYMIGEFPEYFHWWYSIQLSFFIPVRYWTYRKTGYHYFLADLCYFVNLLLTLSIWVFPNSKRLLISTFCLAFGNNAIAIALWRNSLVFHSLDKVTSLFIHIMPCATLHVMIHIVPEKLQRERFPAVWTVKHAPPGAPEHYSLSAMAVWATLPYAFWQLSYHFLITVRRREKIAQGRPTSFTFLRKSYKNSAIGKFVLSFPETLQEAIFMGIQYCYAMLTMLPCPLWFWYRKLSALFLMTMLTWASWNGATYYIDVFGRRMEKELDALKKEVSQVGKPSDAAPGGHDDDDQSASSSSGMHASADSEHGHESESNSSLSASVLEASTDATSASRDEARDSKKDM